VPRVLHVDSTTEALGYDLAHGWPSAGVLSSEAGVVFGSHSMGPDSITRNLSQLNVLWDGGTLRTERRTSKSFTVRGARLTLGLQVQATVVRTFVTKSQGQVRGSGFLARFLVAWPTSTQGYRPFVEAPDDWPCLEAYRQRIWELLNTPVPVDDDWCLTPRALSLSGEAKQLWIAFHDAVEAELRPGGELDDARDVASKAADNAARLACLFHILEHGPSGEIGAESIERAAELVRWYLTETRRFLGSLAINPEAVAAQDLLVWLIRECQRTYTDTVPAGNILRLGPDGVRTKSVRDAALAFLAEGGWLRLVKRGKQKLVILNPKALLQ
jgi:putative DNA primase/helicase